MLNILENFDLAALDPLGAERFHLVLEAARLGYAVRDTHIADAAHMRIAGRRPARQGLCQEARRRIDRHASAAPSCRPRRRPAATRSISRWSIATAWRSRSSTRCIQHFGSGICTEKTGIMLNNRGSGFVLEPDHPNTFGPDKRPMHTIIPALAMRDGRCDMSFGVMGAHYQPMGHAQIVINMVDYGMDVQQAIDASALFLRGRADDVERGMPAATDRGTARRAATTSSCAPLAVGRRAGDQDRLGARRADRAAPSRARTAARSATETLQHMPHRRCRRR